MAKNKYFEDKWETSHAQRQAEEMAKQDYEVARIVESHQNTNHVPGSSECEIDVNLRNNLYEIQDRNKKAKERLKI